ncbi:MAG: hypothetical protein OXH36_01635 [Bdellovibrionales bacterium]|nr:hypothetical protein [Bdellovibrionales bacterium]
MKRLLIIVSLLFVGFAEGKEVDPICEKIKSDRDKALSNISKVKFPKRKLFTQLSLAKAGDEYSKIFSDLSKVYTDIITYNCFKYFSFKNTIACKEVLKDMSKAYMDFSKASADISKAFSDAFKSYFEIFKAIKEGFSNYSRVYADHSKAHAALSRAADDYSKVATDISKYCEKNKESSKSANNQKIK